MFPKPSLWCWPRSAWGCWHSSWWSGSSVSGARSPSSRHWGSSAGRFWRSSRGKPATFAALSLVIGIPLGIVVGRGAWALFAGELGVGSTSVVPSTRILLCVPAVLLIAMLVAIAPAWFAARVQPARALQAE